MNDKVNSARGVQEREPAIKGVVDCSQVDDPELATALHNFKLNLRAWSSAAQSRARSVESSKQKPVWLRAVAWGMSCVLAVALAGGGLYERHHRQEQARIAANLEVEHQRQLAEDRARYAEDLLARVDSDVSREVPNAFEPLAQLMEDESR